MQSLAKPWYVPRALRIFRDQTSLSTTPELWSTIERALAASRFFLLLASPEAARSRWVETEVAWWLEHRSAETLLIALTGGRLVWDDSAADFDPARTDAVPPAIYGSFTEEPLWADVRWAREKTQLTLRDPRFRERVAELAAPLHGVDKGELIGEDVRLHRRAVRLARAVGVALIILFTTAAVFAFIARD
jgi:hypothetical protein